MKRGKKVFIGLLLLGIVMVSLGFVIGAEEEGELADTTPTDVTLTVSGSSSPPEIVFISDIGGALTDGAVPPASRNLVSDGIAVKTFEFYVWSDGGVAALPTGVDVTDANAFVVVRDKNAPNDERRSSDAGGVTCVRDRDAPAPAGSVGHVGEQVRVYSCGVPMQFYDDYGSATVMNWDVNATIKDIFAQPDNDTTSNTLAQPIRSTYFNRLDDSKMVPATGDLNFGTVAIQSNLNKQPNDVAGQYPLQIVNIGNSDVTPIEVTGYDIPGVTDSAKFVRATWFSMGSASPCSGTALVHNTLINSGLAKIIHSASANSDLRVCLREVQASATQQEYKTNQVSVPAAIQWTIDTTFVAA